MKLTLLFLSFFITSYSVGQNINSENYYDYYNPKVELKGNAPTTAWLNKAEASKILFEEMEKAGFEWVSTFIIIKLNETTYINAICYSEKSNVGFVYEASHEAFPDKENRKLKSLYKKLTGNDFSAKIVELNGNYEFIKVKELPENIQIIKEDLYWYQYNDNKEDEAKFVNKSIMLEIFRSDVRKLISKFKK